MEFIINNWYIIVALLAAGAFIGIMVYRFIKMPASEQLKKVRAWLLGAVTEAEKALGSGTGQLKLRSVYDLFVQRFTWLAKIVPFEKFSDMVDDALVEMRELIATNEAVAAYVANADTLVLEGISVEDMTDDQLRAALEQMGYAYTEGMTREEMLAALDEVAEVPQT